MVNVIMISNPFAAPIALALLCLVLINNIFGSKKAFGVLLSSISAVFNCFNYFWMCFSVNAVSFSGCLSMLLAKIVGNFFNSFRVSIPVTRTPFPRFLRMSFLITLVAFALFVGMTFVVVMNAVTMTLFASSAQSISSATIQRKTIVWQEISAGVATLVGMWSVYHDAFLSSYSMWSSADGGISRRSGATLADDNLLYSRIASFAIKGQG